MATYTSIPSSDVDTGSPLTVTLVTALRDNPTAIAEGASGAPRIKTAAFEAGAVDAAISNGAIERAHLGTATASTAGSIGASTGVDITLNAYAFFPHVYVSSPLNVRMTGHSTDANNADNPRFGLFNNDGSINHDYAIDYRYISA